MRSGRARREEGKARELLTGLQAEFEFQRSELVRFRAEVGAPLSRSWSLLPGVGLQGGSQGPRRWPGETLSEAEAAEAYGRLLADQRFRSTLAARYTGINVQEYEDAIAFVDDLLVLIDADLQASG